jgi:hypothetical protein
MRLPALFSTEVYPYDDLLAYGTCDCGETRDPGPH